MKIKVKSTITFTLIDSLSMLWFIFLYPIYIKLLQHKNFQSLSVFFYVFRLNLWQPYFNWYRRLDIWQLLHSTWRKIQVQYRVESIAFFFRFNSALTFLSNKLCAKNVLLKIMKSGKDKAMLYYVVYIRITCLKYNLSHR